MMDLRDKRLLLLMLLICVFFFSASAAAEPVIQLKAKVSIDHEILVLDDMAGITCGDAQMVAKLAKVEVARLALPGQTRLIYPSQVQLSLKRAGIPLSQVRLAAAGPVKVTRNYLQIPQTKIIAAIRGYIEKHAPWDRNQMKVGQIRCPKDVRVPNGKVDFRIAAPKHTDWLGQVTFRVHIDVDGEPARHINVSAPIQVWSPVVLTAKPMARGEPIDPDDLNVVSMNLAKAPANAVLNPEDAIGGFAGKAIAANTILRADLIRIPPLVRKGDVVRIVARSSELTVSTNAMAKEDGAKGERIRLVNLRSKKTIYAKVVGAGNVEVDF